MNSRFTINYAEFEVADLLARKIKGISVFVPLSRQEKGVDLALVKYGAKGKNKILTIQVKYSRHYKNNISINIDNKTVNLDFAFWYKSYSVPENADWNILTGTYPRIKNGVCRWEDVMLAFKREEMKDFIRKNMQKRSAKKKDPFFDFYIDNNMKNVYQLRGRKDPTDLSKYLLKNRLKEMRNDIDAQSNHSRSRCV